MSPAAHERPGAHAQASASSAEVELSWVRGEGAEGCPDARALRAAASSRLGRDPFGVAGAMSIEVVVAREAGTLVARIYARDSTSAQLGSRTLRSEAESCASLAEAAALAIALVIDPEAVERQARARDRPQRAAAQQASDASPAELPRERADRAAPAAQAEPATNRGVASAARRERATPVAAQQTWVNVHALGSAGLLPGEPALGASLSADLPVHGPWGARAGLSYWPERTTETLGGRFGFGLTAGSLAACIHALPDGAVGASACAGGWLGSIHAVVYQLEPTAPGDRLWGGLSLAAELHARLGRSFRLSLGAQALAPATRHRFTVRARAGAVFRQSPVTGTALLGAGVSFW
jgi:hypothetical protein